MKTETQLTLEGFAPRSLPVTPRPANVYTVPRPRIQETATEIDMLALLLGKKEIGENGEIVNPN